MAVAQIVAGTDFKFKIALTDVNGDAIAISGVANIEVALYAKKEKVLQYFNHADGQVETVSDLGGIVAVNVDRANTTTKGRLYAEVKVSFTDSAFESNEMQNAVTDIVVCDIVNSAL